MRLSVRGKAYLLIGLNIAFIFILFLWFSDIKFVKHKLENIESSLQPTKLIITDHRAKLVISFTKNANEEWILNCGDACCRANEHALDKILFNLNNVLSEEKADMSIMLNDLLWSINITDHTGNETQFDVAENGTKITRLGKIFYSYSTDLQKYLSRSSKSFVDERLWEWDIKEARFFKLQSTDTILTFSKKNDSWHMELPFNRSVPNTIIMDALKILCAIHCHSLADDQKLPMQPELSVTIGSGDHQVHFDLFQDGWKFLARKNDLVFEIPSEFNDSLEDLLKVALNLHIFDNLCIDSLELQKISDERTIVLQKLGTIGKWQASLRDDHSMNFKEIDNDEIIHLKKILSELSLKDRINSKNLDDIPIYKLCLYSDIGILSFQIFENCTLFHEESGSAFEIPSEFVKILHDVIDICKQDDDRDFSGTGS